MTTPWTSAPWEPRKWQREALSRIVGMDGSPLVRAVTGAGKSILIAELAYHFELTRAKENLESEPKTMHGVPVRLIDPTVSYIRKTCLFFQCEGYISFLVPSGDWYGQEPTSAQLNAVGRMSSVLLAPEIPWAHKRALVVACRSAPSLTRRDVTELLEILRVLQKYEWPEQSNMEVA